MKIKVCGMRDNIHEVVELLPDFMGFIFWPGSTRYITDPIPNLPPEIRKVGVVVDIDHGALVRLTWENNLDYVQLHGSESPEYCERLKALFENPGTGPEASHTKPGIIKAFNIGDNFNFNTLKAYTPYCDYFLFDAAGKLPGGNGIIFNWDKLGKYEESTPYFLSGGIGPGDADRIAAFLAQDYAALCKVIDINSGFESAPGYKDKEKVNAFIKTIKELG